MYRPIRIKKMNSRLIKKKNSSLVEAKEHFRSTKKELLSRSANMITEKASESFLSGGI